MSAMFAAEGFEGLAKSHPELSGRLMDRQQHTLAGALENVRQSIRGHKVPADPLSLKAYHKVLTMPLWELALLILRARLRRL